MKILSLIIVFLILFASSLTLADDDYVIFAKALQAEDFDESLPSIPVEQWLTLSLPPGIVAVWGGNITDCGEETGNPVIDRERDMPLCAEIELKKRDKSVGYLLLFVGTRKKGKLKEAAGLYFGYIRQGDKTINLKSLQEITKLK